MPPPDPVTVGRVPEYWVLVYSHQLSLEGVYDCRIQLRLVQHVQMKPSEEIVTSRESGCPRVVLFQPALTRNKSWLYLPILHQPMFKQSLVDKLCDPNKSFGAVVLLTCAITCCYSNDPHVMHPITTSTSNTGRNLFNQVNRLQRTHLIGHQLYGA